MRGRGIVGLFAESRKVYGVVLDRPIKLGAKVLRSKAIEGLKN